MSGGLHGVEGFFGSAVQLALLDKWASQAGSAPPMRCLLLHGLNPFGFAWLRRSDENNVDPNRNFLLDGEGYAGSPPAYAGLDKLLNPARPPSVWEPFALRALWAVARHGMSALKQAVAGGQYDFPKGLFYGGGANGSDAAAGQATRALARGLPRGCPFGLPHRARGVGRVQVAPRLCADRGAASSADEMVRARVVEVCESAGVAYTARGGFGRWCVGRNRDRDYLYTCAEFGTYGPIRMLGALRAENQAHHWGKPGDPSSQRPKQRLKEAFCPSSPRWRRQVLERSLGLVEAAVTGMRALNVA